MAAYCVLSLPRKHRFTPLAQLLGAVEGRGGGGGRREELAREDEERSWGEISVGKSEEHNLAYNAVSRYTCPNNVISDR